MPIGEEIPIAPITDQFLDYLSVLEQLLRGTPVPLLASPRDLAFGLVALYFGVDMLSHLQSDRSRAESLLDLATRLSSLAEAVLPRREETTP